MGACCPGGKPEEDAPFKEDALAFKEESGGVPRAKPLAVAMNPLDADAVVLLDPQTVKARPTSTSETKQASDQTLESQKKEITRLRLAVQANTAPADLPAAKAQIAALRKALASQGGDVMMRLKDSMWALELNSLSDLFTHFDGDGSGTITAAELRAGLADAKQKLETKQGCAYPSLEVSEADAASIFQLYDADGSGHIQYHEFVKALGGDCGSAALAKLKQLGVALDQETLRQVFDSVDEEDVGRLDYGEIEEALQILRASAAEKGTKVAFDRTELDFILSHFDKDGSGEVTEEELLAGFGGLGESK